MSIKRYRPFHDVNEDIFLKNHLRRVYISSKTLQSTEVDIILPTFNRSELLIKAINSVCSQLHRNWNLYICDDGSTDNTTDIVDSFLSDKRINYFKLAHKGVAHARNAGLNKASGKYISFLDSDNTWAPEYLTLMITFMDEFSLDCAYCAAKLIDEANQQWLGDIFDWQECVKQNYIDMNCFMTKLTNTGIKFNEDLQRFVDWDYILALTQDSATSYLPCSLVNYCNSRNSTRITTTVYRDGDQSRYINSIKSKYINSTGNKNNRDCRFCQI